MGFWSSAGSFFSGVGHAITGAIRAVGTAIAGVGRALFSGIASLAEGVVKLLSPKSQIEPKDYEKFSYTAEVRDIKPENYESVSSYISDVKESMKELTPEEENKLENLNETEKKKHKSNTISTIFQAFGEDLGLEEPISFGTIKGAAEIKMDANEFKKMLEDHKDGKIPTTNIDAYLNNELDADDDVAMYKYLKEKLDKMDEEFLKSSLAEGVVKLLSPKSQIEPKDYERFSYTAEVRDIKPENYESVSSCISDVKESMKELTPEEENKLENLNETEKKRHKSNTISTIFQAFGEDLGLKEPISFGTIKGAAEIKMDANEFKKMLEDHKDGKIPTTNIDAYLNNELDADDDVAMYKYLKEKLDKMDEELEKLNEKI